ncbi:MAG: hypothetical protein AAB384_02010 [Patescibacteria group bacterium]
MYLDNRPPNSSADCPAMVIVLESSDFPNDDLEGLIQEVMGSSSSPDSDPDASPSDQMYWYVCDYEPRRVWDCTERALRSQLKRWNAKPESFKKATGG